MEHMYMAHLVVRVPRPGNSKKICTRGGSPIGAAVL